MRVFAPWLLGTSSAGEAFAESFMGMRQLKMERERQRQQDQLAQQELGLRRETLAESKRQHEAVAKHQERKDALEILNLIMGSSEDAGMALMKTPEYQQMFPAFAKIPPWAPKNEIAEKLKQIQQWTVAMEAAGQPITGPMMTTVMTKALTGTSLPAGIFKLGEGGEGGGGGRGGHRGRGGGGEAGPGGAFKGEMLFYGRDEQGNPTVYDWHTRSMVPYDPDKYPWQKMMTRTKGVDLGNVGAKGEGRGPKEHPFKDLPKGYWELADRVSKNPALLGKAQEFLQGQGGPPLVPWETTEPGFFSRGGVTYGPGAPPQKQAPAPVQKPLPKPRGKGPQVIGNIFDTE